MLLCKVRKEGEAGQGRIRVPIHDEELNFLLDSWLSLIQPNVTKLLPHNSNIFKFSNSLTRTSSHDVDAPLPTLLLHII